MDDYKRFIAYIYEYDGRVRLGNKGFARIDIRNGCGRLFVSMKDVKKETEPLGVYFYRWNGGIMQSLKIDEIKVGAGAGEIKSTFKSENIADGIGFDDISGIVVGRRKGKMYGAEWDERDINMTLLDINGAKIQNVAAAECECGNSSDAMDEEAVSEDDKNIIQKSREDSARKSKVKVKASDKGKNTAQKKNSDWRSIFNEENIIQPFDDDMMYDCVEVTPELMMRVPFNERNLYNNSFLLHGYFNYGHIIIGKLARPGEGERYFVGVPGTYNNREKVIASLYGFENFRRSIRRDYKQPYFGYWYFVVDAD